MLVRMEPNQEQRPVEEEQRLGIVLVVKTPINIRVVAVDI